MKTTTSIERIRKSLQISFGVLIAITLLFASYAVAVRNKVERMREVYGIQRDSVNVTSPVTPIDDVEATAYKDTLVTASGVIDGQGILDNIIMADMDQTLRNVTFLETIAYLCLILCAGVFLFYLFTYFYKLFQGRRKSSLTELREQKSELFSEDLQDPVGLDKLIGQRIQEAKKRDGASDELVLDYIYLYRKGILKPQKKSAYRNAFLNDVIKKSQFYDKVAKIEKVLDSNTPLDRYNYKERFKNLEKVFESFAVFSKTNIPEPPENDRKMTGK